MSSNVGARPVSNAPPSRRRSGSFNPGSIKDLIARFSGPSASQVPPTPENWVIGYHESQEREKAMVEEANVGRRKYHLSVSSLSLAVPRRLRDIAQRDRSLWKESKEMASRYTSQLLWSPAQDSKRSAASNPLFGIVESVESPKINQHELNAEASDSDDSSDSSSSSDCSTCSSSSSSSSSSDSSSESSSSESDSDDSSDSSSDDNSSSSSDSSSSSSSEDNSNSDSDGSSSNTDAMRAMSASRRRVRESLADMMSNSSSGSDADSDCVSETEGVTATDVAKLPGVQRYRKSLVLAQDEESEEPDATVILGKHVLALGMRQASMVLHDDDSQDPFTRDIDAALAKVEDSDDPYDSSLESDKESDNEEDQVSDSENSDSDSSSSSGSSSSDEEEGEEKNSLGPLENTPAMTRWRSSMELFTAEHGNKLATADIPDRTVIASKHILAVGMRQASMALGDDDQYDNEIDNAIDEALARVEQDNHSISSRSTNGNNEDGTPVSAAVSDSEGTSDEDSDQSGNVPEAQPAVRRWRKSWKSASHLSLRRKASLARGKSAESLNDTPPDPVVVEGKRIIAIGLSQANFDEENLETKAQREVAISLEDINSAVVETVPSLSHSDRLTASSRSLGKQQKNIAVEQAPNQNVDESGAEPLTILASEPANKEEHLLRWMSEIRSQASDTASSLPGERDDMLSELNDESEVGMEGFRSSNDATDYDIISDTDDSLLDMAVATTLGNPAPTPTRGSGAQYAGSRGVRGNSGLPGGSFSSMSSRGSRSRGTVVRKLKPLPSSIEPATELARESVLSLDEEDEIGLSSSEDDEQSYSSNDNGHEDEPEETSQETASRQSASISSLREVSLRDSDNESEPDIRDLMEFEMIEQIKKEENSRVNQFFKYYSGEFDDRDVEPSTKQHVNNSPTPVDDQLGEEESGTESSDGSSSSGDTEQDDDEIVDDELMRHLESSSRALGVLRASYCAIDDELGDEVSEDVIRGKGEISVGFKLAKLDSLTEEDFGDLDKDD